MTLSVALIVKNEKDHIDTVLSSVQGCDEIVVCDTGSTDNTVELARKYTDKVFTDYVWEDHFANARNHALSKCTGDWVLSIDGDELLQEGGIDIIRTFIENATEQQKTFSVKMRHGDNVHYLARLFRNDGTVSWRGRAHETLIPVQDNKIDVTIVYGHSTAHYLDKDRMLRILTKAVEENPESARDLYYLAREYYYRRNYEKAIEFFAKCAEKSKWNPERADAYLYLSRCYFYSYQGDTAREMCLRAIQSNPDFKEALSFMAELHYEPLKSKWQKLAAQATNTDVLFIREIPAEKKPLDMSDFDIQCFKNILTSYKSVSVLEWGSGNSTKYFTDFLQNVGIPYTWEAVEHHRGWHDTVKKWGLKNVEVCFAEQNSPEYFDRKGTYDVIFIDGRNRRKCLIKAKDLLKEGGVVLLHDADRVYYHSGFDGYHGKFLNPQTGISRLWMGTLDKRQPKIPKVIHQIWIGPKKQPIEWMNTWKEKHPDFEYRLWDEKAIDDLNLKNRSVYDKYYSEKCFNGCANIARTEILERLGGVYVDADMECLHTLSDSPFLDWDIFSAYEADNLVVDGHRLVANSIIGAIQNHPTIVSYREKQGEITEINPSWRKSGPLLWSKILNRDAVCLPPYTFFPEHHSGMKNKVQGIIYARQYWGTTKNAYGST